MTPEEFAKAMAAMSRPEVEPMPKPGPVDAYTWLKLRADSIEGWESDVERAVAKETFKAAKSVLDESVTARQQAATKAAGLSRTAKRQSALDEAKRIIKKNHFMPRDDLFSYVFEALGDEKAAFVRSRRAQKELLDYYRKVS